MLWLGVNFWGRLLQSTAQHSVPAPSKPTTPTTDALLQPSHQLQPRQVAGGPCRCNRHCAAGDVAGQLQQRQSCAADGSSLRGAWQGCAEAGGLRLMGSRQQQQQPCLHDMQAPAAARRATHLQGCLCDGWAAAQAQGAQPGQLAQAAAGHPVAAHELQVLQRCQRLLLQWGLRGSLILLLLLLWLHRLPRPCKLDCLRLRLQL